MRSKTACRTSTFICRCVSSARADSPLNFGGTGNNARRRTGILTGLFLVRERMLPTVIYTGQAFLSPEKLVRGVWSENPIIGTKVDPAGSDFYRTTKLTVSTKTPPIPSFCGLISYLSIQPPVHCVYLS